MGRTMPFVFCLLAATLLGVPAGADDPPAKLTPGQREALRSQVLEWSLTGLKDYEAGRYAEAQKLWEQALAAARRVYPKDDYPGGHRDLAACANNLALVLHSRGRHGDAEPLFREGLAMLTRLHQGDHPGVAQAMSNLADVLHTRGRHDDAETLLRDSLAMRRRLFRGDHPDVAQGLTNLAAVLNSRGDLAEGESLGREALAMYRRLHPDGHPTLAQSLTNLAAVLHARGKYAEGERLLRESLGVRRRLHEGDHPDTALCLNNLGVALVARGKYSDAESVLRDALRTARRVFPGDHPQVAMTLGNLAEALRGRKEYADAEPILRESLEMKRRMFGDTHPGVARGLNNLGALSLARGTPRAAELLLRESLGVWKRVHASDHPDVAMATNNLGWALRRKGDLGAAASLLGDSLDMYKRVYGGDHPDVARVLLNLGEVYHARGRHAEAVAHLRESMRMYRSLAAAFAAGAAEGDALDLLASAPLYRDAYVSVARATNADPAAVYAEVWASKGSVARVFESRHLAARAAGDGKAAAVLEELAGVRRRRANLILAPRPADPALRRQRDEGLRAATDRIADLEGELARTLPGAERAGRLDRSTPDDLRAALPADAVFVDLLEYTDFEYDPTMPGIGGERRTERYLGFVVTREGVVAVDLGAAEPIAEAARLWQEAIARPPHAVPADLPAWVRERLWSKLRAAFPAGTRVVYVCPDVGLSRLPWAALPGDAPGTVVLEEFAVAVVPHGPFLLDKLLPRVKEPGAAGVLVAGGVEFAARPEGAGLWAALASASRVRGELPVDPKTGLSWDDLPGAKAEAEQVAVRAGGRKLGVALLTGRAAAADRVLAELPKARYAHLATHGFFADKQFRSVLQVDPELFGMSRVGERVGAGALNPMVMSGLVFAGANRPGTPGRGILTGEHLIDRDLSGLELAVLSACETGLGDVAGGEGVYSLQRAFHVAGTRNVVASLWKVPDAATAALMGEFYRHLWDDKKPLPPIEALRQAQLAVYRADPKQFAEMARRGPGLGDKSFDDAKVVIDKAPVNANGKNMPVVWAAWVLSGPGR